MRLTKGQLKQIIQEELGNVLTEFESNLRTNEPPPVASELPGPLGVASNLTRGMWWTIKAHLDEFLPDDTEGKAEMMAAATEQAEQEEAGEPSGYPENPNNPSRMAEAKKEKNT